MSVSYKMNRDEAGWALVWDILSLMAVRGFPGAEPVFQSRPAGSRWHPWQRQRLPVDMPGWRLGQYSYPVERHTRSGLVCRADVVYPVYLLADGRIVGDAFHNLEPDGTVSELRNDWGKQGRCPPWCVPARDHGDFFEIQPGAYLPQLAAFYRHYAQT